jgi:hypothetical protein
LLQDGADKAKAKAKDAEGEGEEGEGEGEGEASGGSGESAEKAEKAESTTYPIVPEVADFMFQRTIGNPFYTEQATQSLQDANALSVRGGRCVCACDI